MIYGIYFFICLQERGGGGYYDHGNLALKQHMDNEFDLLFVAVYQKILQLSYVDKFLSDIQREFRDRFRDQLKEGQYYQVRFLRFFVLSYIYR